MSDDRSIITKSETFVENPMDLLKIMAPIILLIFVGMSALVNFIGITPTSGKSAGVTPAKLTVIFFFANSVILLIIFLVAGFSEKRTVTCYPKGCDINSTNFWNTYYKSESFGWREVSEINLGEQYIGKGGYVAYLEAIVRHQPRRLMTRHRYSKNAFDALVEYINEATPHLPYVWEKPANFGDRQVIDEIKGFSKVTRA